jgi:ADP-ribose pyrophosphatase YjhB (NUDIX family)
VEPRGQVVKAMVLIPRPLDGALLVSEGTNPSGELFHRPLGGHVEFGEYARDTIHRELREEIAQELKPAHADTGGCPGTWCPTTGPPRCSPPARDRTLAGPRAFSLGWG